MFALKERVIPSELIYFKHYRSELKLRKRLDWISTKK